MGDMGASQNKKGRAADLPRRHLADKFLNTALAQQYVAKLREKTIKFR